MKKQSYDERQLYSRGVAYKYTTLAFALEISVWAFLREFGILDAEPIGELLVLIVLPFIVLMTICIVNDAYNPINARPGLIVFGIMPFSAMAMFYVKWKEHAVLMNGRCITADGGLVLLDASWLVISAVYWIKYMKERRQES